MRSHKSSRWTTAFILLAGLAAPVVLTAQNVRYKFIDIGTLGGPSAAGALIGPGSQLLNDSGAVAGTADTATLDPDCGCFVSLGLRWQDGVLAGLATVPGGEFTGANAINARGWIVGFSDTNMTDPVSGGPAIHAVLWKDTLPVDLGTLGTGLNSAAWYIKDSGQVVGNATVDATADPFGSNSLGPFGSPTHVFTWKNGRMHDVGTLGGPDSFAAPGCNDQREDLVAGSSFIDSSPNPDTGLPTLDPFLSSNGKMTDLGSLGGTFGYAQCANSRGEVIGQSSLEGAECFPAEAGNPGCHAFLWNGATMTDLGTLGGSTSSVLWLNDDGEAVGGASTAGDEAFHGTLWRSGTVEDLGTLPGDCGSLAWAINSKRQIVGVSHNCDTDVFEVVLWEDGSITDLGVATPEPLDINDRGEIEGVALPPGCNDTDFCPARVFLLVPCPESGIQDCDGDAVVVRSYAASTSTNASSPNSNPRRIENLIAKPKLRQAQPRRASGLSIPHD